MNEERINQRLLEYAEVAETVKILTAKDCRALLVIFRMKSRCVIDRIIEANRELRRLDRYEHQLKGGGVIALPLTIARENAKNKRESAQADLVLWGAQIMAFLDRWEEKGATLLDLCHLCGHEHRRTLREIEEANSKGVCSFSKLMFICNLDFRNDRADSLDYETDAPLTHAVKDYMLDVMLNTEAGQTAAHQAFEACFPELWDQRLYSTRDSEGNNVLVNKDGEIVSYTEGE